MYLNIYDNKYRKVFPLDQNLTAARSFKGFWKYFMKEGETIVKRGPPIYSYDVHYRHMPSIYLPQLQNNHRGLGEVVNLKYTNLQYPRFQDLLKIVDKDAILVKAQFGILESI